MSERVQAFVNRGAGSAARVLEALEADPRCEIRVMPADRIGPAVAEEAARGTPAVLVAGGDGTLAAAAGAVAGSRTLLGVIPAGTLNHFAHDHGLPVDDPTEALRVRH
jgi:diacylglycerol kinase family enzyme